MNRQTVKNIVFVLLGTACIMIGIIGIFLPVLPTTPFLLLASFFYLRSSKRMHHWLMNHRLFGSYLRNYVLYRAVSKPTKIRALVFLWMTLAISMLLVSSLAVRILLVVVGVAVTIHLVLLKTLTGAESPQPNDRVAVDEEAS